MSYAAYDLGDGKGERGYAIADICGFEDCEHEIDRGLAYLCYRCTSYFCYAHLTFADKPQDCFAGQDTQTCQHCAEEAQADDAQDRGYNLADILLGDQFQA